MKSPPCATPFFYPTSIIIATATADLAGEKEPFSVLQGRIKWEERTGGEGKITGENGIRVMMKSHYRMIFGRDIDPEKKEGGEDDNKADNG